ncbi:transcription elongation factor NusA, partial [Lacticaseibacillus rhamnosus MTCC 5462]
SLMMKTTIVRRQSLFLIINCHWQLVKGQNARLAAKLTGYKIDIKPESEVEFVDDDELSEAEVEAARSSR